MTTEHNKAQSVFFQLYKYLHFSSYKFIHLDHSTLTYFFEHTFSMCTNLCPWCDFSPVIFVTVLLWQPDYVFSVVLCFSCLPSSPLPYPPHLLLLHVCGWRCGFSSRMAHLLFIFSSPAICRTLSPWLRCQIDNTSCVFAVKASSRPVWFTYSKPRHCLPACLHVPVSLVLASAYPLSYTTKINLFQLAT